ncbi:hypothetical protein ACS3QZ_09760 [Shimia sp. W99]
MGPGRFTPLGIALFALPLYGGPVLAGLSHGSPATFPAFVAAFLFYIVATRKPPLKSPQDGLALFFMALVQCVLVAACMGLGLALSRLTGPLAIPLPVPVLLTVGASLWGAWRYCNASEIDATLDQALNAIESPGTFLNASDDALTNEIAALLDQVEALPATPDALRDIEETCAAHPAPIDLADALLQRADHSDAYLLLALRLYARTEMATDILSTADLGDLLDEAADVATPHIARAALELETRFPGYFSEETRAELAKVAE